MPLASLGYNWCGTSTRLGTSKRSEPLCNTSGEHDAKSPLIGPGMGHINLLAAILSRSPALAVANTLLRREASHSARGIEVGRRDDVDRSAPREGSMP